jgi:hypothetical protein
VAGKEEREGDMSKEQLFAEWDRLAKRSILDRALDAAHYLKYVFMFAVGAFLVIKPDTVVEFLRHVTG